MPRNQVLWRTNYRSENDLTLDQRFWLRVDRGEPGACWLWKGYIKENGYGAISPARGKVLHAHRLAWQIHHGEIPKGLHIIHKCDVRHCVNPGHMRLGTHRENMEDMWAKGRRTKQPRLLDWQKVKEIREAHAAGTHTAQEMAAKYGISVYGIRAVITFQTWKNAPVALGDTI